MGGRTLITLLIFALAGFIIFSKEIPIILKFILLVCLVIAEILVITML